MINVVFKDRIYHFKTLINNNSNKSCKFPYEFHMIWIGWAAGGTAACVFQTAPRGQTAHKLAMANSGQKNKCVDILQSEIIAEAARREIIFRCHVCNLNDVCLLKTKQYIIAIGVKYYQS